MTCAYDRELIKRLKRCMKEVEFHIRRGYTPLKGPSYETPAEIKMLSVLGADAVGMSTVPEVIAARQMNINVFGISCITNLAAGISKTKLSIKKWWKLQKAQRDFIKIITEMISEA